MICPHIVNVSMMLGAILSWGILWPYIDGKAGDWFPDGLKEHDFKGLFGYQVTSSLPCPTPLPPSRALHGCAANGLKC